MKRSLKICMTLSVCGALLFCAMPDASFADRTAPAGETVMEDRIDQIEAELKRLREEKAARERSDAEAKRKAEQARKRAAEQRARAERERAARARRAAEQKAFSDALNRGANFISDGRYRDGLTALREFVKQHPYSADAWYWIAIAHNALGDYDRAQNAVNIALEIDPYYPALTKTPSGLEPVPPRTRQMRKEPRPSMSVLPVKPSLPTNLALEPVVISFPYLVNGSSDVEPDDESGPHYAGRGTVSGSRLEYRPFEPNESGRTVAWMQDEAFKEISRWRFRVDRMGILTEPRVPIAWKGSQPYEVYFWTGTEWARVRRTKVYYDHTETFDDTLAHAQASIRDLLWQRGYQWNEGDTPALAASASHMRYMWVGDVDLEAAHKRAEKLAAEHFVYESWGLSPSQSQTEGGGAGDDGGGVGASSGPSGPSGPSDGGGYY